MCISTLGWHHQTYEKLQSNTSDMPFAKQTNKQNECKDRNLKYFIFITEWKNVALLKKKPYPKSKYIQHVLRLDFVNVFGPSLIVF